MKKALFVILLLALIGCGGGGGDGASISSPDTNITSFPLPITNIALATFQFTSTKANSTFECSLDNAVWAPCISAKSYNIGVSGDHIFKVRAMDNQGNTDPTPAEYSWKFLNIKTYGTLNDDTGWAMQQTNDGGYIIAGSSNDNIYLLKVDSDRNQIWEKTYIRADDNGFRSIYQTADGGYIGAGYTQEFGTPDYYLVKFDSTGNITWEKTYSGIKEDWGFFARQTSDNGYIMVGESRSFGAGEAKVYIVKTDGNGDKLWEKTFGGGIYDSGRQIQQISDGYIIIGSTASAGAGGSDIYLLKIDLNGNKIWDKTFGGTADEWGNAIQWLSDGYIITGSTSSKGAGGTDIYLIKTDLNGIKIWEQTFGGTDNEEGVAIQQTADNGFIVIGYTRSSGAGSTDAYFVRTDSSGNKIWDKVYGGTGYDVCSSGQQVVDGGYICSGWTDSFGAGKYDVMLIKTDTNGNLQ